jgi:hypothetical protein
MQLEYMRGNGSGGAGSSFIFGFDGGRKQTIRNRHVKSGPTIRPYALTIPNTETI